MKISLINNLYKPFNRGGAEKVCETIAAGLKRAGHEVFIVTTKPRATEFPISNPSERQPDKIVLAGTFVRADFQFPIYHLSSGYYNLSKLPKIFRFFWHFWNLFNFAGYFKIKKILKKEKCEAVITNNLLGLGFLTPLAIRNLKIKHLHVAHDIQLIHPSGLMYYGAEGIIDNFFAKIYSSACRALFKSPSIVIFPSRWLKDFYLKRDFFSRAKIMVLSNPADFASLGAGKRSANFTFLFIGQIEKHKGVFLLIQAFNKIKKKYPRVELLAAGHGAQLAAARRQAQGNKNIKFLGWPGEQGVQELLNSSHCLVYPSLVYENCPNAIGRALAAGLPVLASDLGGIAELLSDGAGVLFKPADAEDLACKMTWLVENKNSLGDLAKNGRRQAEVFKAENYVKRLEELIISHT